MKADLYQILATLHEHGFRLWADREEVRWHLDRDALKAALGPNGDTVGLYCDIAAFIKKNKAMLLGVLRPNPPKPDQVVPTPPSAVFPRTASPADEGVGTTAWHLDTRGRLVMPNGLIYAPTQTGGWILVHHPTKRMLEPGLIAVIQ